MKAVSSNLQSLDANSFSSFSSDVFIDLSDNREPLSSWSDFIAGSIAGKLIRILPFQIAFGHNNNFLSKNVGTKWACGFFTYKSNCQCNCTQR